VSEKAVGENYQKEADCARILRGFHPDPLQIFQCETINSTNALTAGWGSERVLFRSMQKLPAGDHD
jgi:hypothetical protein